MSYLTGLRCSLCHTRFAAEALYVCDRCLGPLEATYDRDALRRAVSRERIAARPPSLWRYREFLPIEGEPLTGMTSGFTPLLRADRLAAELGMRELYLKDDSVNHPTLSYKDRVVPVAATRARELGFRVFGCASTGNLANSVAAHAARLGLDCYVFIPRTLEPGKILGSAISGPHVVAIDGTYDDVNRLCTQVGDRYGWAFANINLRAFYAEGAKTYGFEIVEQLGWRFPRHLVCPVAGGTLLPRIGRGFHDLLDAELVDGDPPRVHAAQAAGCAPVIHALDEGLEYPEPVRPDTIAKSIAIGNPADGYHVLRTVRESGGTGRGRHGSGDPGRHRPPGPHRGHLHRAGGRHHAGRCEEADRSGRDRPGREHGCLHNRQRLQDGRRDGGDARSADSARPVPPRVRGVHGRSPAPPSSGERLRCPKQG